jgi:hypothetical protein
MKQDINFTRWPVGMGPRGREIAVCPVCGLNGEFTSYTKGESIYVHTAREESGWMVVREKCMLPA